MLRNFFVYCLFTSLLFCVNNSLKGQENVVQRLEQQLTKMKPDSSRVDTLYELAYTYNTFDPVKGLATAKEAFDLAKKIGYWKGQSKALSVEASSYRITGDFNKALDIYLEALKLAETHTDPKRLATALMYIAILHAERNNLDEALPYYLRSDSIIRVNKINDMYYYSFQNLGDLYEKKANLDSAFYYYNKSLKEAFRLNDNYLIGATYGGLGSCHLKKKEPDQGLQNDYQALYYLKLAGEEDLYSKTAYEVAQMHELKGNRDSALYYARVGMNIARKDQFQSRILDISSFLSGLYKKSSRADSALAYLETATAIKDSINSLEKVKDFQQKTFKESIRQAELAEKKRKEEEERRQEMQLLIIGISIPAFFIVTLFLSRRKIHRKLIQVLGIISLLMLFEYLTLLLHPVVVEITHHTPFLELLIFVGIAAMVVPAHHRIEHWLIDRLTTPHKHHEQEGLKFTKKKISIKKTSG